MSSVPAMLELNIAKLTSRSCFAASRMHPSYKSNAPVSGQNVESSQVHPPSFQLSSYVRPTQTKTLLHRSHGWQHNSFLTEDACRSFDFLNLPPLFLCSQSREFTHKNYHSKLG